MSDKNERRNRNDTRLLDAREAAAILRMDSRTLVRWARLGQVPSHTMGEGRRKLWRFLEHELIK
jgi:predicted site-specific integrase-resolvase